MSELLHSATRKLIDDPIFLKIIETKLNSIMKDGKIDRNDIPDIVVLLVYCTNNLKDFNLTYVELKDVLEETISYLLNQFNVIPEDSKEEFNKMINTMVSIVMLTPRVKSCFFSFWDFIRCKKK